MKRFFCALLIGVLTTACAPTVCVTREDAVLRERLQEMEKQVEEQQMWVAGCQDDNSDLQSAVIELEGDLRDQALETARVRTGCSI